MHPATEPTASGRLDVGGGNAIWWEEAGRPDGVPTLILHGGPGSGSSPALRQFFDPRHYRIISFDQRGCGQSTPHASEQGVDFSVNTTPHLVGDIELLRIHLGVERWVLYGQSWGSTLGLAYAERYPDRVAGAVFAGVTTTRRSEIAGLFHGAGQRFPEAWARFMASLPQGTGFDAVLDVCGTLLFDPDPAVRDAVALAFHKWDFVTLADPSAKWPKRWDDPSYRLARARICAHYFRHAAWLAEGELLAGAGALGGIPAVLVQGQNDLGTSVSTALELAAAWPGAELVEVADAGHSSGDAAVAAAIVRALDTLARRFG